MPNRTATFSVTAGVPTGDQTTVNHYIFTVTDAANAVVGTPQTLPSNAGQVAASLPVANGYKAALVAYDNQNTADANPPTVIFDVPAPPPPPRPADPILGIPTIS